MKQFVSLLILGLTFSVLVATALGSNYVSQPPATVYENPVMSPQTMGFDPANNMFIAHPGWINDKLIHYYKFRMYTPGTYPTKVTAQGSPNIPIAPLYLITTTAGDFTKIVQGQNPVIRWHTADGEDYSDFDQVYWVVVSSDYVANTYRSYEDIVGNVSSSNITASNVYANVPVVPTGSKLQDPITAGLNAAPILPMTVWYRGVQVQTFVFETTSQKFADYFNPITRSGSAAAKASGYEISVVPFVSQGIVNSVPICHLNQYSMGVTTGVNQGGPWRGGSRNIIGFDRSNAGYSPLWRVFWVSKVPINYQADMASDSVQLTASNGFQVMPTPMYVNCPNVGPMGGSTTNTKKASSFSNAVGTNDNFTLAGALVMEGGKTVRAYLDQTVLATATTNMMGAFIFNISAAELSNGQSTINVKDDAGNALFDVVVTKGTTTFFDNPIVIPSAAGILVGIIIAAGLLVYRRNSRKKESETISPAK